MNNTASQQNASSDRLRGCVDRVFFAGPTFSAGRVRTASGEFVPFSGKFYAQEGTQVVMKGRFTTHPKYGEQFQVATVEHDLDGEPPPPASTLRSWSPTSPTTRTSEASVATRGSRAGQGPPQRGGVCQHLRRHPPEPPIGLGHHHAHEP